MEDNTETDPREVQAAEFDLNYIGMDGNIACLGIVVIIKCHTEIHVHTLWSGDRFVCPKF